MSFRIKALKYTCMFLAVGVLNACSGGQENDALNTTQALNPSHKTEGFTTQSSDEMTLDFLNAMALAPDAFEDFFDYMRPYERVIGARRQNIDDITEDYLIETAVCSTAERDSCASDRQFFTLTVPVGEFFGAPHETIVTTMNIAKSTKAIVRHDPIDLKKMAPPATLSLPKGTTLEAPAKMLEVLNAIMLFADSFEDFMTYGQGPAREFERLVRVEIQKSTLAKTLIFVSDQCIPVSSTEARVDCRNRPQFLYVDLSTHLEPGGPIQLEVVAGRPIVGKSTVFAPHKPFWN